MPDQTPALALAFQSSFQRRPTMVLRKNLQLYPDLGAERLDASELSRLLLFGNAQTISATLGSIHPGLPRGEIHASTSYGLKKLIEHMGVPEARTVPDLTMSKIEGSLAVFGGPVSNLFARLVMGIGGPSPLFGTTLPITFNCSEASKSTNPFEIEPWKVVVDGRSSRNECLVVTSMPLAQGGERLTIFSGLHGAGTRAIGFLLADAALLHDLYLATRGLPAWQAIFEVQAIDKETPRSLGDYKVYEISNVDFRKPDKLVRDNLILTSARADELIEMLPQKLDPTDIACTSIVNLYGHKLWNRHSRARVAPANLAYRSNPEKPPRSSKDQMVVEPQLNEAAIDPAPNRIVRKRWGRPPKPKSDASLTRRLQIMLSEQDIEMIDQIMHSTDVPSMGQVIRDAIRREHSRLAKKPQRIPKPK